MPKFKVEVVVEAKSKADAKRIVGRVGRNPSTKRVIKSDSFGTGKAISFNEDDDGKFTVVYTEERTVGNFTHPYRERFSSIDAAREAYEKQRAFYKRIALRPYERVSKRPVKEADYRRPYVSKAPEGSPERTGYKLGYDDGYAKLGKLKLPSLEKRAERLGFTSSVDSFAYVDGYQKGYQQATEDKKYRRPKSYT